MFGYAKLAKANVLVTKPSTTINGKKVRVAEKKEIKSL